MQDYLHHAHFDGLVRSDFINFAAEYVQIIDTHIPTTETITFLDPIPPQPADSSTESEDIRATREAMQEAAEKNRPVLLAETLYLPFNVQGSTILAELNGLDDYLVRKIGNDWLDGLQKTLCREFLLIKRANIDSITGLLNSWYLNDTLNRLDDVSGALILLSVTPQRPNVFVERRAQSRMVSLLRGFIGERFPLYSLGQSCFAIVCKDIPSKYYLELAPSLVSFFKREGYPRVHVASITFATKDKLPDENQSVAQFTLNKGWVALHVASKRGPFAFYSAPSEPAKNHPLNPPSAALKRWVLKLSKDIEKFSLIQFNAGGDDLKQHVLSVTGSNAEIKQTTSDTYLFLPYIDKAKLKKTAEKIIAKNTSENKANAGIAIYTPKERSKSALLLNCRKALCHAAFLTPGSVVICDAVSFNISGDIYYGEGDLVHAVAEYKKGLELEPKNGNLLNSLGVCYAQMNRSKDALHCFKRACESQEDRFMALYNLGFEQQQHNNRIGAIKSFSAALDCPFENEQEGARKEITFQLSVLYCHEQQYDNGVALLEPWYAAEEDGKALKYLGELYSGLAIYSKAKKYLQLAMRYDEYDAEVLGLLGEIYLLENEGDDIALRFCEKAVELSPDSSVLKLRLAKAQIHCGDLIAAAQSLTPCLRNKKTRLEALRQKVVLALEMGKSKTAEKWQLKAELFAADNKE